VPPGSFPADFIICGGRGRSKLGPRPRPKTAVPSPTLARTAGRAGSGNRDIAGELHTSPRGEAVRIIGGAAG